MKEPQAILVQTLELKPGEPLTLPESFKTALGLESGGTCTAIRVDSVVLVIPRALKSQETLERIRQALEDKGLTLEDLLSGLEEIRAQLLYERYGLTP